MTQIRIADAARLLGVSDDTVRRLAEAGTLAVSTDDAGRQVVDGLSLAAQMKARAAASAGSGDQHSSARNRFVGIVTDIRRDAVMSQVEMQCGPFRVVSLMSSEAVDALALQPGSLATAVVKATTVIVETASA